MFAYLISDSPLSEGEVSCSIRVLLGERRAALTRQRAPLSTNQNLVRAHPTLQTNLESNPIRREPIRVSESI